VNDEPMLSQTDSIRYGMQIWMIQLSTKFLKLDCYDIVLGEEGFTRFSTRKKIIRREEWTNSIHSICPCH